MDEQLFFCYLVGVPLLGIAAQWLAWRLRLPSILLLLAFGILLGTFLDLDELLARLAGAEGMPGTSSLGPKLLLPVVSLAVAVILFEGGLSLRLGELKTAGRGVFRLVTLGALFSWLLTTAAAYWLLGLDTRIAALLGAVLVVTGPTVVAPLLRHIRPVRRVASIVKWEGIVIDPVGAVLAVLVFEGILAQGGEASLVEISGLLLETAAIGGSLGLAAAWALVQLVKRYWIPDYLHGVAFLAAALGVFAASNLIREESGLVTVTVLGVVLANQKSVSIHHVIEFKEHLRVFLISCLFIVLGSRFDPQTLLDLGWRGVAFLAALIVFVRPLSVFLSTPGTRLSAREKTFLAFLAPRGIVAAAVSSVFALKVATFAREEAGLAELAGQAEQLVPITFLVIVGTVAVYGLSAGPLAKWLGLADTNPQGVLFAGAEPWTREVARLLHKEGFAVMLVDTSYTNVAAARMDGLPAEFASILSEHVREELDLAGIGRLLAVTPSDEMNALAVRELAHVFGRANVYQLPPWDHKSGRRSSIANHLRGRLLFHKDLHHSEIVHRRDSGAQLKKTGLTEEFTFEEFKNLYGESATILFLIDEGNLKICTLDEEVKPQAGQTIVALVHPPATEGGREQPSDAPAAES